MKEKIATLDLTPKWIEIYGTLKIFLTEGNPEQKEYALGEVQRLCQIADMYVELTKSKK